MKTDFEILRDFTNKTLKGEFANEELCRFLITSDFAESDSPRTETVGSLDFNARSGSRFVPNLGLKFLGTVGFAN